MTFSEDIKAAQRHLLQAEQKLQRQLATERGRRRGALNQSLHEVRRALKPDYRYTSQAGQDAVVDRVLRGQRNGIFVDIGGYDGMTGSNTHFLETYRGWSGLLIEPVPSQLAKAQHVRNCPCWGYAVAAGEGAAEFIEISAGYTQMSGLAATYDSDLLETVQSNPNHTETRHQVQTRTIASLLSEADINQIDFLSLDIEGGELAVLGAFDFDRIRPRIWSIENNSQTSGIPEIMRQNGYDLIEFCGKDDVYHDRAAVNPVSDF